jgi:predicted amidohydrolase
MPVRRFAGTAEEASMRVAVVQFRAGRDRAENRARLTGWVERAADAGAELVICPEAAMREFGEPHEPLAPEAEPLDGPFVAELRAVAAARRLAVVAGMFETVPGDPRRAYNTVVAVTARGVAGRYRKLHLFDALGWRESDRLAAAELDRDALLLLPVGDLTVGILTCYDLRFPELARALVDGGATALAVSAAWVAGPLKEEQWRVLVRARAIENTAWVFAAGQPAPTYSGGSLIVDPSGVPVAGCSDGEGMAVTDCAGERVSAVRERMPSLRHRRFRTAAGEPLGVP